jgi:hypothetical protein
MKSVADRALRRVSGNPVTDCFDSDGISDDPLGIGVTDHPPGTNSGTK